MTTQNRIKTVLTLAAVAMSTLIFTRASANAANINLNIYRPATSGPQTGLVGPAGGLGETWNQHSTTSAISLLDSAGAVTSVGYTSSGTSWGGPDTWGNPALAVLRDGLRNFDTSANNSQQFVINGLTEGDVYDVWLISTNMSNPPSNQRVSGQWSTTNLADTIGNQLVDNTLNQNGTTFQQGNNYVFFDSVVADSNGELIFNGNSVPLQPVFDTRLPLNGFQLVAVAPVPEPSTFGLTALSLLSLGMIGWRKRMR